ncbi:hypothetical protein FACS189485_18950 [Spirochaetia bacterium]|nr:hypothetical protein FACS189485_18950 [Spirochaetia bacterium]
MGFYYIYSCVFIGLYIIVILPYYLYCKFGKTYHKHQYIHERYNKYKRYYYNKITNEKRIEDEVRHNIKIKNKITIIVFISSLILWIISIAIDIIFKGILHLSDKLNYLLYIFPVINIMTCYTLIEYIVDLKK